MLSSVVSALDDAIEQGKLREPFSKEDFEAACPGFGRGTYNIFLTKHRRGNPDGDIAYFEKVDAERFRRIRSKR
ncbi:MAG: hypothetical protein WA755_08455 [Candidatus Acidiferrales bacterium]